MPVDQGRVEKAIREILEAVGEDPDRGGLVDTPARVARMYAEILSGIDEEPSIELTFAANHDEMVMVHDIPLYSLCEHHMVPFVGRVHVAYIPSDDGRITGLSKLPRLVQTLARRLQVQERLTAQIADELERSLKPRGVFVVVEAEHLCMSMRGQFRDSVATRNEAMQLIRGR
jgi:GTP cyclohydrolase I